MKVKKLCRFSFPRFLTSSEMKLIAAVRGLYISSMMSAENRGKNYFSSINYFEVQNDNPHKNMTINIQ